MTKNDLSVITAFFFFSLGLILFTFYTPNYYSSKTPIQINIKKGATLNEVIDVLYKKKVIHNKTYVKIAAYFYGAENKIREGYYTIPNGMSYLDLIEYLSSSAGKNQKLITIPEGIWLPDLAKLLKNKLNIDSAKFVNLCNDKAFIRRLGFDTDNLEGYLLPETYYFFTNSSEKDIIAKLTNELKLFFTPKLLTRCKEINMTQREVLILASIVDGETNRLSEFPIVASVYLNRLKIGMALQADPTIQYLIRDSKPKRILRKHLEMVSPFNTYLYTGLPPAPINNPGKAAIKAVLYPSTTNYLYFVADGNGGHRFSRTLQEHNSNVYLYRQAMDSLK